MQILEQVTCTSPNADSLAEMFLFAFAQVLLSAITVIAVACYFFLLPPKYPIGIPAVPFWVTLIPFFRDVDQEDTYRKYVEKPLIAHGAIKIFFAARWNIVVQKPSFVAEVFKNEEVFQKTGNQKKIPHTVLADFLG
jgi:unspecific monooxygenase